MELQVFLTTFWISEPPYCLVASLRSRPQLKLGRSRISLTMSHRGLVMGRSEVSLPLCLRIPPILHQGRRGKLRGIHQMGNLLDTDMHRKWTHWTKYMCSIYICDFIIIFTCRSTAMSFHALVNHNIWLIIKSCINFCHHSDCVHGWWCFLRRFLGKETASVESLFSWLNEKGDQWETRINIEVRCKCCG